MRRRLLTFLALALLCAIPAHGQSTGTLIPSVSGQYFDNSGNVCSSCLLYSYTAGTSTPLNTYSDSGLSVANTNPIVLNSAGRNPAGGIYLTSASYKFILKTAAAATLWTQDNVASIPYTTIASSQNSFCDGRLTLTTVTPVTVSDVTAATTVRWTPYKGNRCALYDGSTWNLTSFTEVSLSLGADAGDTNYDVFLFLSSGTPTLQRVAWASDTVRATSITLQDGVYVKSSDLTKRYLGTYRTTSVAGQTEDSDLRRFVWNYYNRVPRRLRVQETTDSWTYTLATWRQARASTANQIACVVGVSGEGPVELIVMTAATNSGANVTVGASIGEDSTTAPASNAVGNGGVALTGGGFGLAQARLSKMPTVGYHYYAWLEFSTASGTTTWYGDNGGSVVQNGMTGWIQG
jgi:hypothetical protein